MEHNVKLPPLPTRFSFSAVFKRFSQTLVKGRQSSLESWLLDVYQQKHLRSTALIEFLTLEPEVDFVLDFSTKTKLEVVVKKSGAIRLYAEGEVRTPRTPWIPSESELQRQLETYHIFPQADERTFRVPLMRIDEEAAIE
eukprot:c36_g1_i1.p2 GENE.c36_g1_i1~~c36_g1_i1.p2  ORF type:complete len:140 (-),score=38.06 c36_g1_i1:203-622(-)